MALWRNSTDNDDTNVSETSSSTGRDITIRESQELFLGAGVHIQGELAGTQDVRLEGTAEGEVNLPDNAFTVGPAGRVDARVSAKRVVVKGAVAGDIVATDSVLVAASGEVRGTVSAPRIVLADGCTFNGAVNPTGEAPRNLSEPIEDGTREPVIPVIEVENPAPLFDETPEPMVDRPAVDRRAVPRETQAEKSSQAKPKVEQVWSSGGGAFWTMARPYDEKASGNEKPATRPNRTRKPYDRIVGDISVEIIEN
jgi:cytoskeletal protein CcmA (bactofilin family)